MCATVRDQRQQEQYESPPGQWFDFSSNWIP
jgi:hypothetical protein